VSVWVLSNRRRRLTTTVPGTNARGREKVVLQKVKVLREWLYRNTLFQTITRPTWGRLHSLNFMLFAISVFRNRNDWFDMLPISSARCYCGGKYRRRYNRWFARVAVTLTLALTLTVYRHSSQELILGVAVYRRRRFSHFINRTWLRKLFVVISPKYMYIQAHKCFIATACNRVWNCASAKYLLLASAKASAFWQFMALKDVNDVNNSDVNNYVSENV